MLFYPKGSQFMALLISTIIIAELACIEIVSTTFCNRSQNDVTNNYCCGQVNSATQACCCNSTQCSILNWPGGQSNSICCGTNAIPLSNKYCPGPVGVYTRTPSDQTNNACNFDINTQACCCVGLSCNVTNWTGGMSKALCCGTVIFSSTQTFCPPASPSGAQCLTETRLLGLEGGEDLTTDQLQQMLGGYVGNGSTTALGSQKRRRRDILPPPPASKDWRQVPNVLGPIKNQGSCGVCWSFASVAAIESHYGIKYNKSIILSEQELISCITGHGVGCNTLAAVDEAYSFLMYHTAGLSASSTYPYVYQQGDKCPGVQQCKMTTIQPSVMVLDYQPVNGDKIGGEEELKSVVGNIGPVAIAIVVSLDFSKFLIKTPKSVYKGCTYPFPQTCNASYVHGQSCPCSDPKCPTGGHAVLAVGYGTSATDGDYWIIRNSWGTIWGDAGYFYLARNVNMCGIGLQDSFYPEVISLSTSQRTPSVSDTMTCTRTPEDVAANICCGLAADPNQSCCCQGVNCTVVYNTSKIQKPSCCNQMTYDTTSQACCCQGSNCNLTNWAGGMNNVTCCGTTILPRGKFCPGQPGICTRTTEMIASNVCCQFDPNSQSCCCAGNQCTVANWPGGAASSTCCPNMRIVNKGSFC